MAWGRKKDSEEPQEVELQHDPEYEAVDPEGEARAEGELSVIGRSLRVVGELRGSEDLLVDGHVQGSVTLADRDLTVGRHGVVRADIRARSVLVEGDVVGDVHADDRVEIAACGTLCGDLHAARIVLADGARYRGSIDMGQPPLETAEEAQVQADALLDEVASPLVEHSGDPIEHETTTSER